MHVYTHTLKHSFPSEMMKMFGKRSINTDDDKFGLKIKVTHKMQ